MRFENAYQLYSYLSKHDLVKGFWVGIEAEFEIDSSLKNQELIKLLEESLAGWIFRGDGFIGGYHWFSYESDSDLEIKISIDEDLNYSLGNPFDIERILQIVCDVLDLKSIDREEYLEHQITLDFEVVFENLLRNKFFIKHLKIKPFEKGQIKNELKNIRQIDFLSRLEKELIEYVLKEHDEFLGNHYQGFELSIRDNFFGKYNGIGQKTISNFKEFMEDVPLSTNIQEMDIY